MQIVHFLCEPRHVSRSRSSHWFITQTAFLWISLQDFQIVCKTLKYTEKHETCNHRKFCIDFEALFYPSV